METGVVEGLYRDPSIQIIPTWDPQICKYHLHWAIWIPGLQVWYSSPTKRPAIQFFLALLAEVFAKYGRAHATKQVGCTIRPWARLMSLKPLCMGGFNV